MQTARSTATVLMDGIKLDEVRAAIAACNFLDGGSTQKARQRANLKRSNLYASLDRCRHMLDSLEELSSSEGDGDTSEIKSLRKEVEALAATLVIRPVQSKPLPLLGAVDFLFRAPATLLFMLFMGFVVSIPLIILTMIEQQLFLFNANRRRKRGCPPPASASATATDINSSTTTAATATTTTTTSNKRSGDSTATTAPSPPTSELSDRCPGKKTSAGGSDDVDQRRRGGGGGSVFSGDKSNGNGSCIGNGGGNGVGNGNGFGSGEKGVGTNGCNSSSSTSSGGGSSSSGDFSYRGLSSLIKRLDAHWSLLLMGVDVRAEGLMEPGLLSRPAMLLFSHASTLDAMIILGTFPRPMCAVVKEELFAVPVVGWIMASHGGIPINRRNRASAVQALAEAGERARELGLFVAMAPEGTRSKNGQLAPYKKGAMHMQEQLHWPVIPVTVRGGFELFPHKSNFNECGRVIVRFHKPIGAEEISSRDDLSRRLRQEMLEAVQEEDWEAGTALGFPRRLASVAAAAFTYWAAAHAAKFIASFSRREGVAVWALVLGAFAYIAASTLFVYYVYARKCFSAPRTSCSGRIAPAAKRSASFSAGWGGVGKRSRGYLGEEGAAAVGEENVDRRENPELQRLLGEEAGGAAATATAATASAATAATTAATTAADVAAKMNRQKDR